MAREVKYDADGRQITPDPDFSEDLEIVLDDDDDGVQTIMHRYRELLAWLQKNVDIYDDCPSEEEGDHLHRLCEEMLSFLDSFLGRGARG